jgi:hypothetical protein
LPARRTHKEIKMLQSLDSAALKPAWNGKRRPGTAARLHASSGSVA